MYFLMVKKAYPSGLKYLCQTKREPYSYKGSGLRWENHIKFHKPQIVTCVIGEYETMEELKSAGLRYSELFDVVKSEDWANLRAEDGTGGGAGKVGRRWKIKDTSRMGGPKTVDKTTERYKARILKLSEGMKGGKNPRNRFPQTEKQKEVSAKFHAAGTEASKKGVIMVKADQTEEWFESKRAICKFLNISYDILNYRIDTERNYQGIRFITGKRNV